jgi:hypothetical protein
MKTFKVFAAFAILGLLLSVNGFSQSGGVVRGFVYDKKTGEPLIGASVYLNDRTKYAAGTDVNGFFTLSKIPAGKYTLYAEVMGYGSVKAQIGIGTNFPSTSAELDIYSTSKGILAPRVSLSAYLSNPNPVINPAVGIILFNIGTNQTHGFYYWSGIKLTSNAITEPMDNRKTYDNGLTLVRTRSYFSIVIANILKYRHEKI